VNIPDYISPIVGYRIWRWSDAGLRSLNDEHWSPRQALSAGCRRWSIPATTAGMGRFFRLSPVPDRLIIKHRPPNPDCTCGVYAAKKPEHLRKLGYAEYDYGVHGEVYLRGTVVEHSLGWRAQFAYPKSLFLPLDIVPFTKVESRLQSLIAYGTDIYVVRTVRPTRSARSRGAR
jgi:hypothetical protein